MKAFDVTLNAKCQAHSLLTSFTCPLIHSYTIPWLNLLSCLFQYPNVVPLQAIVGQGAALQGSLGPVADPTAGLHEARYESVTGDASSSGHANV